MSNGLSRRNFLKVAGCGALGVTFAGCAGAASSRSKSDKKPNIIFIMLDDLGPEWISCYGADEVVTPNVDKLAAQGMRFTNAYSMPKCTPTRVTLLTGQYPYNSGWINHWDVPRWSAGCHFDWKHYTTFAQVLKTAGYTTAVAGKWQINDFRITPDALVKHGFDDYCMWTGYETQNPPSGERYWNPYIHTKQGSKTYKDKFGEEVFTDFLIDFMKQNKDKPMMLYYPMCLPHGPLTTTPLEPNVSGKYEMHKAMVKYTDHCLGRIVKAVDELGIRDNTIIIWTTDNGSGGGMSTTMNGRKVKGGKGKINETGCGAPFIVNCPALVPAGVVTDALTDFTDMLPTFAELAGAKIPKSAVLDGHSIAPLLLGKTKDSQRNWIMAMGGGEAKISNSRVVPAREYADRVVRDKQYKLWVENGKPSRLFDMIADPGELNNLIDSTDAKVAAARTKLKAVIAGFPTTDAVPKYTPVPAAPWSRKANHSKNKKKK